MALIPRGWSITTPKISPPAMPSNTGWTLPHEQKTVAITLRELAPFDKRLGTTQQAYEKAFAGVVNRILDEGYQVIALSTCTGIDSYNKDDRMVALNLRRRLGDPARYHVVMDELNDLEMGKIHAVELTVGTRLHSAIISMNFATPAIARIDSGA